MAAIALLALAATAPACAAFSGLNGKLVYESDEGAPPNPANPWPYYEIYTINPDGTGRAQLTSNSDFDGDAAWSPDGSQIAFSSERDGFSEIYTMAAGGGVATRLTNNAAADIQPAWSPDGSKIAFVSFRDGSCCTYNTELYVMDADGTDQTRITNEDPSEEYGPAWSPDGGRIAFQRTRFHYDVNEETYVPEHPEVVVMNSDGTDQQTVATASSPAYAVDFEPAWSPDGNRIAFPSAEGIALVNSDGTNLTVVNTAETQEGHPAWSPDGTKIAFDASTGGRRGIYTMNLDGSGVVNVNNTPAADEWKPDWQPVQRPHVRPIAASPIQVSLVPSYQACTGAGNRRHGPPLNFPSCAPPVQSSPNLTVRMPGGDNLFKGFIRVATRVGLPGGVDDTDMRLRASIAHVMHSSDFSEYTGELRVTATARVTDKEGPASSTIRDFPIHFDVQCVSTPDPNLKSTCDIGTFLDAVIPGATPEGTRAVWALDQIKVYDGGPDEVAATEGDNSLFATQGVFVP